MNCSIYEAQIRYRYIEKQSLEFFKIIPPNLLYFPLNISEIIKYIPNCRARSYEHISETQNIPISEIINVCESESGCTHYDAKNNRFLIMYNAAGHKEILGRTLFTLAHELGHIFLYHLEIVKKRMIAEKNILQMDNIALENEADYFASCILSPFQLFKDLNINSSKDIEKIFGLSYQASKIQYREYQQWLKNHFTTYIDNNIRNIFENYIKSHKNTLPI